jgi:hyperosmotically inducible protein
MHRTLGRLAAAAAVSLALAGCATTGQYFDDSWITTKVKADMFGDSWTTGTEISVTTQSGVVQLAGFTGSQAEIDKAGQIASKVPGVKSVKNDVRLKPATR